MADTDKRLLWLGGEIRTPPLSPGARIDAGLTMDKAKRRKLEADGWTVGDAADFLGLSPEEDALVEVKLSMGRLVRKTRTRSGLSQLALARRLRSSQSRVAKLEAGDSGVSLDLLVKAAFAVGARRNEIARAIAHRRRIASR